MDITTLVKHLTDAMGPMTQGPVEGMRVGAFVSMDEKEVRFLGYGKYLGDERPPYIPDFTFEEAEKGLTDATPDGKYPEGLETIEQRRLKFAEWREGPIYKMVHLRPKILLDDGEVVWGNECHFMPPEKIKEALKTRRLQWVCFARKEDGTVSHEIEASTA